MVILSLLKTDPKTVHLPSMQKGSKTRHFDEVFGVILADFTGFPVPKHRGFALKDGQTGKIGQKVVKSVIFDLFGTPAGYAPATRLNPNAEKVDFFDENRILSMVPFGAWLHINAL